jgi:uncharacterized protein (TIRG00374 family)
LSFRWAAAILGLAVSAAFTYLAFRRVDFDLFWAGIKESDVRWLGGAVVVLAATLALRAFRWRLMFRPKNRPSFWAALNASLIGYLFNNILPARAGEAARVVALNQETGVSRSEAAAAAVAERVYDVVVLLILLFVASPFLPNVDWLRRAALVSIALAVMLVVGIVIVRRYGERPLQLALWPLAWLPGVTVERTDRAGVNALRGLAALINARFAVTALLLTVLSWLVAALSFWFALFAFSPEAAFGAGLLVVIATNLALIIPSSPAAIGVFEASTLAALSVYGFDKSSALAYAVVVHGIHFFTLVAVGLFVLQRHVAAMRTRARSASARWV